MTTSKRFTSPSDSPRHGSLTEYLAAEPPEDVYLRDRLQRIEQRGGVQPSTDQGAHSEIEILRRIATEGKALGMSADELTRAKDLLRRALGNSYIREMLKSWGEEL